MTNSIICHRIISCIINAK